MIECFPAFWLSSVAIYPSLLHRGAKQKPVRGSDWTIKAGAAASLFKFLADKAFKLKITRPANVISKILLIMLEDERVQALANIADQCRLH